MKKCLGCGSILQTTSKDELGYTPKIDNDLCMRCFKLKHYGNLISTGKIQDNQRILNTINHKKSFVLFIIDFLNIYDEIIATYKKINNPKMLIMTKSDLIPKNIKTHTLISNIKNIYDINEEVMLVSSNNRENLRKLENLCLEKKNVLFAGFTNAGKSSLINALVGSDITVSRTINTTQEFISLKVDGVNLTDAPGFIGNTYASDVPSTTIKPLSYQLSNKYYLKINDLNIASAADNNLTLYLNNNIKVEKRKIRENLDYGIIIPSRHDLVIKGLGFITFSKITKLYINIDPEHYEIRPTIIGGKS